MLGEAGVEQLLKSTIEASVSMRVLKKTEFERIIVDTTGQEKAIAGLMKWLGRAERFRTQQRHSKNKLYALHAPEVECIGIGIGNGKARKPCEFGVKVSLAVAHKHGLMVGARSFPGTPYDGHTLAEQLEWSVAQSLILPASMPS